MRLKLFNKLSQIRVIATERAKHFINASELCGVDIFSDQDEWNAWTKRGDEVLHIELVRWADVLIIAPLDANSLGKIASVDITASISDYYVKKCVF